ncbi:MAG: hypothetical protein WA688_09535 [Thermoplasmata archaeon]
MWSDSPLELRVEIYSDGELTAALSEKIGAVLALRWPVAWDVNVPTHPSFEHPAEWQAVVPFIEGSTPETLHQKIVADLLALDPNHSLHFRTRWDFQQSPNHQEVYEERWKPSGH